MTSQPHTPVFTTFHITPWKKIQQPRPSVSCLTAVAANHQGTPVLMTCLTIGTPCDNDLCALLVRFRSHCFGLSTDIERLSYMAAASDDRDYTRFFWLSDSTDPSSPLCVYRFKVVPFGATSSPFMLNAVLQYHLKQYNTPVSNDMLRNLCGQHYLRL